MSASKADRDSQRGNPLTVPVEPRSNRGGPNQQDTDDKNVFDMPVHVPKAFRAIAIYPVLGTDVCSFLPKTGVVQVHFLVVEEVHPSWPLGQQGASTRFTQLSFSTSGSERTARTTSDRREWRRRAIPCREGYRACVHCPDPRE